jgi:hypothetical protein
MQARQFPRWIEEGRLWTADYFCYPIPVTNTNGELAAAGVFNTSINIQRDSDFEWLYSTAYASEGATPTYPYIDNQVIPITLQIKDGGAGRELFYSPIPLSQIAGVGRQPYPMPPIGTDQFGNPMYRRFMSTSTVNFYFASLDAANAWYNVSFTMHGRKIFDLGPPPAEGV